MEGSKNTKIEGTSIVVTCISEDARDLMDLIIKNRWGFRIYGTINRCKIKIVAGGLKLAQYPTVFYNVLCAVYYGKRYIYSK